MMRSKDWGCCAKHGLTTQRKASSKREVRDARIVEDPRLGQGQELSSVLGTGLTGRPPPRKVRLGHARPACARKARAVPNPTQIASASHSYTLKCPGTKGMTFIRIISRATSTPEAATTRW